MRGSGGSDSEQPEQDPDKLDVTAPTAAPLELNEVAAHVLAGDADMTADVGVAPEEAERRTLPPGTIVGRYVVLDEIATGGMGAVYKAFDPELDRTIAIKVVSVVHANDEQGQTAAARLIREAKALAQLSHPNVVAIYDVGRFEDDVFIAMAFVEGVTLREWLREGRRATSEILEVFVGAAKGLAAAHRAGLVHRDFKPDNVLIGVDGRVRVVDFGIARAEAMSDDLPLLGDSSISSDSISADAGVSINTAGGSINGGSINGGSINGGSTSTTGNSAASLSQLTRAGALMGTPRYMAPEQLLGEPVDAKTDQFGFCVVLFEALYDRRPFAGSTLAALRKNVVKGRLRSPPKDSKVPGRLRRLLERGLAVNRDERHASMDDLIAELSKDPRAAVRRAGFVAGAALVAGLGLFGFLRSAEGPTLCEGAEQELRGHWDPSVKAAARAAFLATKKAYAAPAFERVANTLDRYAESWVAMRTASCRATHVQGSQSERMLDLRMRCLDQRREALSSLATVLSGELDAATVEKGLEAAIALPDLDGCTDDEALTAAVPPPSDPKVRAAVAALGARLATAAALDATAQFEEGLQVVGEIDSEVEKTGYAPLHAKLRFVEGKLRLGLGDGKLSEEAFRAATLLGARARNDELVADAWTLAMRAIERKADYEAAMNLYPVAQVAVARAGDSPLQQGRLQYSVGRIYYRMAEYETSLEHEREALELMESELGADHPDIAEVLNSLGSIRFRQAKYTESRKLFERALALRERVFGEEHPVVAITLHNLGAIAHTEANYEASERTYQRALSLFVRAHGDAHPSTALAYYGLGDLYAAMGRFADARAPLQRSLVLHEQLLGADHPLTASSLASLGGVLNQAEEYQRARVDLERALAIWEARLGPKHPKLGIALGALAVSHAHLGEVARALEYGNRALDLRIQALGADHDEVATSHVYLAEAQRVAGRCGDAVEHFERAIEIIQTTFADDHSSLAAPLSGLGDCYLQMRRPADARNVLERAQGIRTAHPYDDALPGAKADMHLAEALWETGEPGRALELATRAHKVLVADSRPSALETARDAETWLARHRAATGR